ncbi:hypothetical protein [Lysobacter firmicutimachus]|uniref:Uncharacterized protein n=1 Tax=Lysobacter firmicutimachus TaxID=1792846 RepID=A0ABU8D264_9GAMM
MMGPQWWWRAWVRVAREAWRLRAGRWPAGAPAGRIGLARRADRNGQALLDLADEIDRFLACQQLDGRPVALQRHWPRVCRQVAADHLECINRLMLAGVWDDENAAPGKD